MGTRSQQGQTLIEALCFTLVFLLSLLILAHGFQKWVLKTLGTHQFQGVIQ